MAIFKYKPTQTEGPAGTFTDYRFNPIVEEGEEQPHDTSTLLGEHDGWHYRHVPENLDVGEQSEEIQWQSVTLDVATKVALRKQPYARMIKDAARTQITNEIGDPLDLMADLGKLCEFSIVAVCALLADKAGLVPMDEETTTAYGNRAAYVLKAIADGSLRIRGGNEAPEKMIADVMPNYSNLQDAVQELYLNKMKEVELY